VKNIFPSILLLFLFLPLHSQNEELNLSLAIEKALENNYNLVIATRDVEISSINNNWGTAGRYPVISFDASSNNSMDLDRNITNRVTAGLGLSWLLFDGFRVSITKEQLDLQEDLTEGVMAVQIENTIEDIILAWNNILLQKETLEVFRTLMNLSHDRYDYEQKRYDLGGSVTYNVLQAKNVYLADKALVLKQEVEVRNAIRNLNFLISEDAGAMWYIQDSLKADTGNYVLSDLQSKMLSNNQSLKNQYVNIQLRQKQTDLRRSELFPSLRLSAGVQDNYNRIKPSGEDATDANTFGPYGNLTLSYDLYNGGNRRRAIEIAQIEEEIADIENQQIIHLLNNELLSIYDNYNLRLELLNVAREGIESAELNLRIAEEKFRSGAINSFNYRDIQLIYLNAALEKLSALYNLIASHTALTRITGGFLREEE
jgi:outer membrane protein TolC